MIPFQACMQQAEYTQLGTDYYDEGYSLRNLESGDFTPIDPTGVNDWSNMQWVGENWWLTHPYCSWGMGNNRPSSSNAYGIRQKELINWAVYHCACAILWVCEAAGMNSRDSYSDRDQPPSRIYTYTTAMSYQQIKSWRKGELDGRTVSGWEKWLGLDHGSLANITGLAMLLAPALAVASTIIVMPIFLTKKVKTPAYKFKFKYFFLIL